MDMVSVLADAITDPGVIARYRAKVVHVPGSDCWWWTGAISGRGHGRFWVARRDDCRALVIIAHRFAWAIAHGSDSLSNAVILGHRCDNPLCQRVHDDHVVQSTSAGNRQEWAVRRTVIGSPLSDQRGARGRAQLLRDLARRDPDLVRDELHRTRDLHGEQMRLW